MRTPDDFYGVCLDGFVSVTQSFGYANSGARENGDLLRCAAQSVRELLKYKPLSDAFGKDPKTYYYYVNGLAFAMGIVLSALYLSAPQRLRDRDMLHSIVSDPDTSAHDLAFDVMQRYGMDAGMYNQLVQDLYSRFQSLYEPYWGSDEARGHAVSAFNAVFMAGCSILLECVEAGRIGRACGIGAS